MVPICRSGSLFLNFPFNVNPYIKHNPTVRTRHKNQHIEIFIPEIQYVQLTYLGQNTISTAAKNEHATRINLHEHEDDEKGNGLCNVIASYAACAYRKGN